MKLSEEYLTSIASGTGFRNETLEKVIRLGEVLADITRHPMLSKVLALKGGTALNLCYGEPKRLSVDLDFNYVGSLDRSKMMEDRPLVEQALMNIAVGRGYTIQMSREEHAGRKFFLRFKTAAGTRDRIEIDLNFLNRLPVVPLRHSSIWQPGDFEVPKTCVVGTEELCSGKLCALLSRSMPRDLYDAARMPTIAPSVLSSPRFRAVFMALAGTLDHPLYTYGQNRFSRVTEDSVREQLHPMLSRDDRPDAGTLRKKAWSVVEPLLELTKSEHEYAERIQLGDLHLESLFPDDDEALDRLRRHPALLWKVQNARKHAGGSQ